MQEEEGLISLAWLECLEGNVKSLLHPMPQTQSTVPMKREGRHVKLYGLSLLISLRQGAFNLIGIFLVIT